ncbi:MULTISPECIES: DNA methyltransferase [unclassified Mesorhizobium]|uniref:class I SAM-dependent DNA methyltransferase n=2 Tax=Mesorhizobium TaxID=68287 RepID=UPI001092DE52|nr:class I SAM-dependent DNA methyltransferase [Mesorhizobium sp. M4B.F.Ca.ET.214.01.1.1]TGQ62507.1 class I SAM-dependent DNA methyltransferase [Mesorhizobium sp. M4B.F.Ca.ET.211.01.1.1]TGU39709.1 class I SAM-dependent DNA methyltransferase [Mesorhizobium sp. M4B.F.Ca.ET.150.01.1.1]
MSDYCVGQGQNLNRELPIAAFIRRWSNLDGGQERANYSLFLAELCDVIGVRRPDPALAAHDFNDYVFERRVERKLPDGTTEAGRIDLYKRGCFILEAKQSRLRGGKKAVPEGQTDLFATAERGPVDTAVPGLDHVMVHARRQAEGYATKLPADHPYPPFIIACDVGRAIELYADFSGYGRHYAQFPDARQFRIELSQLANPDNRELLRAVWEQPQSLDPAQKTAKVTREIAGQLAEISKALEGRGFEARSVAVFLMRCLFTMFVEDVGLLRKKGFTELLTKCVDDPTRFTFEIDDLWRHMDRGDYSPGIGERLLRFNGKLFKNAASLPLTTDEIRLLRDASDADWRDLEPAIFGTLFEQALDPIERKRLGAHYTPRAYVERVVDTTIIEPLTKDWIGHQSAAEREIRAGSTAAAIREVEDFLRRLASVRVLDPACGTGNFLYVALRRMKQLEGEALKQLQDIGGEEAVARVTDISVKPEQFFGMELNERAVEIAELVLWIGYIQWHMRTRSTVPPEPVLGSSDHVHAKDALITWTGYPHPQLKRDALGKPVTDGQGNELYVYPNAISADWPEADFVVGNPPFIGGKDIRGRLGAGYAEALWGAHPQMNPAADFVMYWWDHAAELLVRKGTRLRRFGFVTTNSITQVFQRRVLERHLAGTSPVSLVLAIPDHPWTKASKDAAAVRIAMTVAEAGERGGVVRLVTKEAGLDTDEPMIEFVEREGKINPDLTIGVDVTRAKALVANDTICSPGVKLHGDGFIITREKALELGLGKRPGLNRHIREYRNGRDLTSRPRGVMVIDLFGRASDEVRREFPEVYQHLLDTVKPERDRNNRASYRDKWWWFGEPRRELRPAMEGLPRYIATVETMKHRIFQFMEATVLPDNMLIAIASDDPFHLGVLSSKIHVTWALRAGGRQGVGNDPRYSKSRCFDPFPFPDATASARVEIGAIAEELDETRKRVFAEHPDLTLTALYNVLEAVQTGAALTHKDQDIRSRSRVLILRELHDRLDAAVAKSFGWKADLDAEQILDGLVRLNEVRAAEERGGFMKWLRPEYQIDKIGPLAHRGDRIQAILSTKIRVKRAAFPAARLDQARVVLDLMARAKAPLSPEEIALTFTSSDETVAEVRDVLQSLVRLGQAESYDKGRSFFRAA